MVPLVSFFITLAQLPSKSQVSDFTPALSVESFEKLFTTNFIYKTIPILINMKNYYLRNKVIQNQENSEKMMILHIFAGHCQILNHKSNSRK